MNELKSYALQSYNFCVYSNLQAVGIEDKCYVIGMSEEFKVR